jgi:energy-coupling factor transport system permease protein
MFVEYLSGESFIHRLDVRTKVFGFFTVVIWSFMFQDPLYNLALMLGIGWAALQIKIPYKKVSQLITPLVPMGILLVLISGFTYPTEQFQKVMSQVVLFSVLPEGRFGLSVGGVLTGINFICRLMVMVIASSMLTLTTPIDDFMLLLNRLRVPQEISFMITTAIRFIPTLDKKRLLILEAQRARGGIINDRSIIGRIRAYIPIMVPLFINSILLGDNLAKGMLNRGYGYTRTITQVREIRFSKVDYGMLFLFLLIIMFSFYLRLGLGIGKL